MLLLKILTSFGFVCLTHALPYVPHTETWYKFGPKLDPSNIKDGIGVGKNEYKLYTGDGSGAAGWPAIRDWVSFEDMFNANKPLMRQSCVNLGPDNGANPSEEEIGQIWNAVTSAAWRTNVDHRFIFAVMLQESKGCVRVHTTANAVSNPGLMQDHDGQFSCNVKGVIQTPCPDHQIFGMIYEGVEGTSTGEGLSQILNSVGGPDSQAYYRAARRYNSGSLTYANLNDGRGSTNCYASDVANRLTGWVNASTACHL